MDIITNVQSLKENNSQINEQKVHVNQIFEQYLHWSVNYQQDIWKEFISLAKLANVNTIHSSTN